MDTLAQIVTLNVSNNYLDLINIEIGNRKSDNTDTCDRLVELPPYYQGINAKNDCNVDWKYVGGIITYGCKTGEGIVKTTYYPYLALKSGVEASVNKIMTGDFNYDDQYASNQLKYENKYNRDLSNPIQDIATTVIFAATTIITAGMSSAFIAPASSSLSSFLTGASSGLLFGAVRIGTMAVIDSLIFSSVNFAVTNAVAYTFGTDTVSLAASFCGTDNATATSCLTNQGKQIAFSIFLHSVGSAAKSGATHIPSKVEVNKFVRSSMGRIIKPAYALDNAATNPAHSIKQYSQLRTRYYIHEIVTNPKHFGKVVSYTDDELAIAKKHWSDIVDHKMSPPYKDLKGGSTYDNKLKELPELDNLKQKVTYQEWDIYPKDGIRDKLRIVSSSDGSVYYTNTHYEGFIRIK